MENLYKEFIYSKDYAEYCRHVHPAIRIPFDVLYKGLMEKVEQRLISCSKLGDLELFKYTQTTVCEHKWDYFTLLARGLILCPKEKKIVAFCFPKFFNYGELEETGCSFIESTFTTSEKVDGSYGALFNFSDKWRIATAGSFVSDQAQWATKWIYEHIPLDKIDKTNTYLFEIVYPENKIVVQYDFEGLVLLGIYDAYGLEYVTSQLEKEAAYMGTRCTKFYNFDNMNSIIKKAETLGTDEEGYVIRFKSGVRLKIKGDEYVRVHKLISNTTPLAIWESILNGDDIEATKKELPEEMAKDFDAIVTILNTRLVSFITEVETMYKNTKSKSDKELGIYMSQCPAAFSGGKFETSSKYIFLMRKGRFYDALVNHKSLTRRKIFNAFKPKANFLEGYVPSSVMNRFENNV